MLEDSDPVSSSAAVLQSAAKVLEDTGSDRSPHNSANDSGHETSSPDSALTPVEERAGSPVDKTAGVVVAASTDVSETSFRINIVAPNSESFDLQVSSNEMVQELHQVLLERESTCHRTCFSLQFNGVSLDHYTELKNISGLKDGSTIKIIEEPYTLREARIHLRHVRELIRSLDMADAVGGIDGASLSYLATMTLNDPKKTPDKRESLAECSPPDYLMPGHKERLMTPLLPPIKEPMAAIKNIAISAFNPPPGPRKLKGDVLYLVINSREDRRYHITCCTKGFYVNASVDHSFRPTPSPSHKTTYHSLVDLLSSISSGFRKIFPVILKKRAEKHIFERLPTPYQVSSWIVPTFEQTEDSIRAEDATQPHKIGLEDHIPGQVRDWNEELQTTHELPRETLSERLIRERAIFKIHCDFVFAAIKGAMAVIDGNAVAINPSDEPRTHMYIWNNIFFSLGFDVKDHYKDLGGDAAAHAATSNDLQGVRAYAQLDIPNLYTLGMVVIDYKGYRVTAQSIIPGILDKEQEQSVVYGSVDFGKTVVSSEAYCNLLSRPAEQLRILPHKVHCGKKDDELTMLHSSYETKGIIGNDSRHYILDLLRTFPPDVNYLEGVELSDACKANGYPRPFPHKLASLRQELIEAFVEWRFLVYARASGYYMQRRRLDMIAAAEDDDKTKHSSLVIKSDSVNVDAEQIKLSDGIKDEKVANTEVNGETTLLAKEASKKLNEETIASKESNSGSSFDRGLSEQVMISAARIAGSTRSDACEIKFNPDCFCTTVRHAESEDLEKQRLLVSEAAEFILVHQMPSFIRDCLQRVMMPLDGASFIEALHSRGINIRYIGKLNECMQGSSQLGFLKIICSTEILCRSAKHIYRSYLQRVPAANIAAAVSHFLNCFLSSSTEPSTSATDDISHPVRKSRYMKRKKQLNNSSKDNDNWTQLSSCKLWEKIKADAHCHYAYSISEDNVDSFFVSTGIQKTSTLRRFAQIVGIQMLLRDYNLETGKKGPSFSEDDVLNLHCVAKHVEPKAVDAHALFLSGQAKVQQGLLRAGFELVAESLNLMNNVYGAVHPDMAHCMRLLARLSYILGDSAEALSHQHKATLMSERCNGLDNANTVVEYLSLAHFSFTNLHIAASLKMLYRARYLLLLIHGENHPLMAEIDGNIGVILYAVQEYDHALKFLQNALKLHQLYLEPRALKTAVVYHLMARTYACRGDFRTALQMEKETFIIYSKTFGSDDVKTKESSDYLKHLTQQAVLLQKKIVNRQGTASIEQLIPSERHRPSLQSVLDILNILNGIIFIQLKGVQSSDTDDSDLTETSGGQTKQVSTKQFETEVQAEGKRDSDASAGAKEMKEEALD